MKWNKLSIFLALIALSVAGCGSEEKEATPVSDRILTGVPYSGDGVSFPSAEKRDEFKKARGEAQADIEKQEKLTDAEKSEALKKRNAELVQASKGESLVISAVFQKVHPAIREKTEERILSDLHAENDAVSGVEQRLKGDQSLSSEQKAQLAASIAADDKNGIPMPKVIQRWAAENGIKGAADAPDAMAALAKELHTYSPFALIAEGTLIAGGQSSDFRILFKEVNDRQSLEGETRIDNFLYRLKIEALDEKTGAISGEYEVYSYETKEGVETLKAQAERFGVLTLNKPADK